MATTDDLRAWDRAAALYADVVGSESNSIYARFQPFFRRHLGSDLAGLRVLDLGCGHGWFSERCRTEGGDVVGVDGSRELLSIARARYPALVLEHADLASGLPEVLSSQRFDRVVAHMVLMDIPTLGPLAESPFAAALRRMAW